MPPWIAWLIAIASITVCLFLWFRDVQRIMRDRKNTMESAASQVAFCRKRAEKLQKDTESAAVLARSEDIYQQARENYEQTRKKPWIYLPATLMGYRHSGERKKGVDGHDENSILR